MGKNWMYGADSDSEYVEYEDELLHAGKSYNMRTRDAISEKAMHRHTKMGIPRRKGHYQLQTRNSSRARETSHFYGGHHWEVGTATQFGRKDEYGEYDDEPKLAELEHTTRRLTIAAVNNAVDNEKMRRTKHEAREREMAGRLYSSINHEFIRLIALNMDEEKKAKRKYHLHMEEEKEDVLQQLRHRKNQRSVDDMMEDERTRRMSLMHDLTDADMCSHDPNLLLTLKSLSKMSNAIKGLQDELMGACNDLEEVSHEEEHAVDDLYLELKDDFVSGFKRATLLMKFHMAEENEKRLRMAEQRSYVTGKRELEPKQRRAMKSKGLLQEELTRAFAGVIQGEYQKETICEEYTHVHKTDTQEQLLHRLATIAADTACGHERARRILEMESELRAQPDSFKEHVKDVICMVQEQMILKKFHGKKIHHKQPQRHEHYVGETEEDRKHRQARMKLRRHTSVVAFDGF